MSKNGIQRFLIPEGFDIEQIIVSNIRPKKKKKEKINAFRFFFLIRKHQLKDVDEIAEDKNQLLSKIDAEWRGLTEVQRKVIKIGSPWGPPKPSSLPPKQNLPRIPEEPMAYNGLLKKIKENKDKNQNVKKELIEVLKDNIDLLKKNKESEAKTQNVKKNLLDLEKKLDCVREELRETIKIFC